MPRITAVIFILAVAGNLCAIATSVSVSRVCLDAAENLSAALDDIARDITKKGGPPQDAATRLLLRPDTLAERAQQLSDRLHQRIQR